MVKVKLEKEQVLLQKHVNIEGMLMVSRGGGREGRREGGERGGGAAQTAMGTECSLSLLLLVPRHLTVPTGSGCIAEFCSGTVPSVRAKTCTSFSHCNKDSSAAS